MKYKFIDKEDGEVCTFKNKKETLSWLDEWNDSMETEYKSIEEFNKGEMYYKLEEIK